MGIRFDLDKRVIHRHDMLRHIFRARFHMPISLSRAPTHKGVAHNIRVTLNPVQVPSSLIRREMRCVEHLAFKKLRICCVFSVPKAAGFGDELRVHKEI